MRVPDHKLVIIAYELRRSYPGMSVRDIGKIVGVSGNTVHRWLTNEQTYHPDIDPVAVARAIGGEKAVYDNLTVFEYQAFVTRLIQVRPTMDDFEWQRWLNELTQSLCPSDPTGRKRLKDRLSQAVTRGTP